MPDRHIRSIIRCERCPRLRSYCEKIATSAKRASFKHETYWGRPIPPFGNPARARLVIVGLAPAAHGANRTGRMFTGDRSGEWLYRAMHRFGFANQPTALSKDDGLELREAMITSAVKCAPPDNKPLPIEIERCAPYLREELLKLTPRARVYVALGRIGFDALWRTLAPTFPEKTKKPKFAHGARLELEDGRLVLLSYHPSQQNTFTGRLTEPMLDSIFRQAREWLAL